MKGFKIPNTTIERLPVYYRALENLEKMEVDVVSSRDLGDKTGIPPAQVRKDLSYYGEFGRRGVGYDVISLRHHLQKILGLERVWPILMVGGGNLGRALVNYGGFLRHGLEVRVVLDNDPAKIGTYIQDMRIEGMEVLKERVAQHEMRMGVLAVPAEVAQEVAEELVEAGILAIWNFSPQRIKMPPEILVRNEDLSVGLMALVYKLNHALRERSV